MAVLEQAQADLPRWEFLPGRGGAELFDAEGIADADLFASAPPATGTQIRYWTGSAWAVGSLKRWNGSAWVDAVMQRWTGAAWAPL